MQTKEVVALLWMRRLSRRCGWIIYTIQAQIAKSKVAQRLQVRGIRKLRQELNLQFGPRSSPVIVFAAGAFAILHLEELVVLLGGQPPQFSFFKHGVET
jgi:hypothetical protein